MRPAPGKPIARGELLRVSQSKPAALAAGLVVPGAATGIVTLIFVAAGYFGGTAAPAPRRPPMAEQAAATSGRDNLNRTIGEQAEGLRRRLESAPPVREPARNPFEFGAAPQQAAQPRPAPAPARTLPALTNLQPAEPELVLLGVAANERDGRRTRIAVIVGAGRDMWTLEEGQTLGSQYRVTRIDEDAAELTDLASGEIRELRFR